jgi:methyl-CpG-binding domain protein 4
VYFSLGKLVEVSTVMRDDLMVQQQIDGPWQHMVGVIMLNQTSRKQVKKVLPEFLKRWDVPDKLLNAKEEDIKGVVASLGMTNIRVKRLLGMSRDYLTWDHDDAKVLYGIGKYGSDSYEIFFKNNYAVQPTDKELRRYLEDMDNGTNQSI